MTRPTSEIPSFGCKRQPERIGILLAQLGTPDAPDTPSLRRYLRQFLSDRRVIEIPRIFWLPLLYGVILWRRPQRSAKLYRRVWTEDGSPLLTITKAQAQGLEARLQNELLQRGLPSDLVGVTLGMRYGNPSLEYGIQELLTKGCSRLVILPMYPQYAAATTGSTFDSVFADLLTRRWIPTLRVVEPYYRNQHYITALATTINSHLASLPKQPERLILSYHGIPLSYAELGDPYCCMCAETTAALKPLLNLPAEHIIHTYQSRFGRAPWLTPYTDDTVEHLASSGIKDIAVACPGFTADCLETIDEIGVEAAEAFHEHGGESLHLIPCLNASTPWLDALAALALEEIDTWLTRAKNENSLMDVCPVMRAENLVGPPFCSKCTS